MVNNNNKESSLEEVLSFSVVANYDKGVIDIELLILGVVASNFVVPIGHKQNYNLITVLSSFLEDVNLSEIEGALELVYDSHLEHMCKEATTFTVSKS